MHTLKYERKDKWESKKTSQSHASIKQNFAISLDYFYMLALWEITFPSPHISETKISAFKYNCSLYLGSEPNQLSPIVAFQYLRKAACKKDGETFYQGL